MAEFRAGFITLLGKPNVGKSTLLNAIVGRKISITSDKPQTTRHRILGVHTREHSQFIFVDTPGLHRAAGKALNKIITRTTRSSLDGVDIILMMIDWHGWSNKDHYALESLNNVSTPVVLVINKIDRMKNRDLLLPLMEESSGYREFAAIVPVSAVSRSGIPQLMAVLEELLPESPMCFPQDQYTDRSINFMIAELVREQVFRLLGQEVPYDTAVRIANVEDGETLSIEAHIWVHRNSQKAIILGHKGSRIKDISTRARLSIEQYLQRHVFLDLQVKVRKGWADNQTDLNKLGYIEDF